MIDIDRLSELAAQLSVPVAVRNFPHYGDGAIREVLLACTEVFRVIDPSELGGPVFIYSHAESDIAPLRPSGRTVVDLNELREYAGSGFTLEVNRETRTRSVWPSELPINIDTLRMTAIVFSHNSGNEKLLIGNDEIPVLPVVGGAQSFFTRPYFANLDQALSFYRRHQARKSQCVILKAAWFDCNKLFFKAGPEDTIRDSLVHNLRIALGSHAEVMPEQKVNPTDPVDIRVTFHFTNRVALIEVKWLGKSKHSDGHITATYTDSRARDGARQLAGYLDSFSCSSPSVSVRGYLVVLDGRRWGLTCDSTIISAEDGMHYANLEIHFDPRFDEIRYDFNEPLRMFAEPITT